MKRDIAEYIIIAITLVGSLMAASMRFAAIETRVSNVEAIQALTSSKLDSISDSLARIEGKLHIDRQGNK